MAQHDSHVVKEEGVRLNSGPLVDNYERLRDFLFRYEAGLDDEGKEESAEGNG